MLPTENRLRQNKDFSAVYQKGIRKNSSDLALRALMCHQQSPKLPLDKDNLEPHRPTRIGISISKKVSKGAVVRNRIKRQIRSALRQMLPCISRGWDIIIVVKPTAQKCNYDEFLQQLEKLLAQAEVLHGYSRGSLL